MQFPHPTPNRLSVKNFFQGQLWKLHSWEGWDADCGETLPQAQDVVFMKEVLVPLPIMEDVFFPAPSNACTFNPPHSSLETHEELLLFSRRDLSHRAALLQCQRCCPVQANAPGAR